jgi:hypothetical protein
MVYPAFVSMTKYHSTIVSSVFLERGTPANYELSIVIT